MIFTKVVLVPVPAKIFLVAILTTIKVLQIYNILFISKHFGRKKCKKAFLSLWSAFAFWMGLEVN
jgi:hypothetical protein